MPVQGSRRILLTGATGFLGNFLARSLLADGHQVRAIVRKPGTGLPPDTRLEEVVGDFVDRETSRRVAAGCDWIIHCAASGAPELAVARKVNVDGTASMLAAAEAAGACRFVQISSLAVYERQAEGAITEQTGFLSDGQAYARTKAEGDALVCAAMAKGFPATVLRPSNILGLHAGSTWSVHMPAAIRRGRVELLHDGLNTLPFIHVEDVVDTVRLVLHRPGTIGKAFNLLESNSTWLEYTEQVRNWFGAPPLKALPLAELPKGAYWNGRYESLCAQTELDFRPRWSFAEAMAETQRFWAKILSTRS